MKVNPIKEQVIFIKNSVVVENINNKYVFSAIEKLEKKPDLKVLNNKERLSILPILNNIDEIIKEYQYNNRYYYQPSHCDICNTAIMYNFVLTNVRTKKEIIVGSECILKYADRISCSQPVTIEQLKNLIKNQIKEMEIQAEWQHFTQKSEIYAEKDYLLNIIDRINNTLKNDWIVTKTEFNNKIEKVEIVKYGIERVIDVIKNENYKLYNQIDNDGYQKIIEKIKNNPDLCEKIYSAVVNNYKLKLNIIENLKNPEQISNYEFDIYKIADTIIVLNYNKYKFSSYDIIHNLNYNLKYRLEYSIKNQNIDKIKQYKKYYINILKNKNEIENILNWINFKNQEWAEIKNEITQIMNEVKIEIEKEKEEKYKKEIEEKIQNAKQVFISKNKAYYIIPQNSNDYYNIENIIFRPVSKRKDTKLATLYDFEIIENYKPVIYSFWFPRSQHFIGKNNEFIVKRWLLDKIINNLKNDYIIQKNS